MLSSTSSNASAQLSPRREHTFMLQIAPAMIPYRKIVTASGLQNTAMKVESKASSSTKFKQVNWHCNVTQA
jgi:hypothetical protein